jgi:lysophospholipase L1-like esterase
MLGGSTAWGLGASSNGYTVAGTLESLLNGSSSSKTYRVFNAAYPGWTSRQELIALTEFYEKFDPDMVITLTGYNDLHVLTHSGNVDLPMRQEGSLLAKAVSEQLKPMTTLHALSKLAGSLGIWRIVVYFREKNALASPTKNRVEFHEAKAGKAIEKIVGRYTMMSEYATRHGAKFIIALQPEIYTSKKVLTDEEIKVKRRVVSRYENVNETFSRYRSSLFEALTKKDSSNDSIVSLEGAFDKLGKPVFIDDCHFNDAGYAQVARLLKQKIETQLHKR